MARCHGSVDFVRDVLRELPERIRATQPGANDDIAQTGAALEGVLEPARQGCPEVAALLARALNTPQGIYLGEAPDPRRALDAEAHAVGAAAARVSGDAKSDCRGAPEGAAKALRRTQGTPPLQMDSASSAAPASQAEVVDEGFVDSSAARLLGVGMEHGDEIASVLDALCNGVGRWRACCGGGRTCHRSGGSGTRGGRCPVRSRGGQGDRGHGPRGGSLRV